MCRRSKNAIIRSEVGAQRFRQRRINAHSGLGSQPGLCAKPHKPHCRELKSLASACQRQCRGEGLPGRTILIISLSHALRKVCLCSMVFFYGLVGQLDLTQALFVGFIYTPVWMFGGCHWHLFQTVQSHRCRFDNVLRSALVKE